MDLFNRLDWQHRRKYAKAWLFFTALFSMMLVSYVVIFTTVFSIYRQENQLLLEQINFFVRHSILEGRDNFDELDEIDFKNRDYVIVIFSPLENISSFSNKPQETLISSTNWQVYKQKTDTTFQSAKKLEAMRILPDGYRMYVYLASPNFYHNLLSPLILLPLWIFFVVLGIYVFYINRQSRAWQSLLNYCQELPHQIINDFQPYPISQRPLDLDMAQMSQVVNRFGFKLNGYFHQLKALSQHQQQLIENMPLSLFIINRKGRITYFNQQFSKQFMTPFYADALYLLSDFVAGKDKINQQALLNLTASRTAISIAVTDLQHTHFYDLHVQPVYNALGKVQSFSGCLQDITSYQNELEEAWLNQKQLQDKLASFDKLWAVLGHELRTPLTGMLGMIDILEEDKEKLTKDHQEVVQTLYQSGQGMLQMLNDMLDIAKLGAGKLNTNIAQTDFFSLTSQVAELMIGNARRQHIDLLYHIDVQIPRYIETDDGRLRQILLNLLSNAIKFTKQGYVALLADLVDSTHPLVIENNLTQNPAPKWLCITVKDTGIGISEPEQKKLFSFFNQANESISRQFGGTGLGLAISNSFSQLLGGFIHLNSEVGKGSEFQVYLPLKNYHPKISFSFNPTHYTFHIILILKYAISAHYVEKLLTALKCNFSIYVGLTVENVTDINQQFLAKHILSQLPLFAIDEHCYDEHLDLLEKIVCFEPSPKIFFTMNNERSLSSKVLEKFDGILAKPITMNNFFAEATRVYDNFQHKNSTSYQPLSAQEAYAQFLTNLAKSTNLSPISNTETTTNHPPANSPAQLENQALIKNKESIKMPIFTPTSTSLASLITKPIEFTTQYKSILVAEDNPVNQKIVQRQLAKLGYEIILAENGQQAIDLWQAHKAKIGLILMDCQMPVMDGLEATRVIRATQSSVPIIALTANHGEEDKQMCLNAGMDNFLTKPLNKAELVRLLNRYMI